MAQIPLGKQVKYSSVYDPALLFPIPRSNNRMDLKNGTNFYGVDIWNCYEVSWLNMNGKPCVRILELYIPSTTTNIVESKSLKLYLFSLNNNKFDSEKTVMSLIKSDLEKALGSSVEVVLHNIEHFKNQKLNNLDYLCIDDLDVECDPSDKGVTLLQKDAKIVTEKFYTNLLRSNCLITSQPDWATLYVSYKGPKIDHSAFLKYIVSFRSHDEFAEPLAERIFDNLISQCKCEELTVYNRSTRRGGIDINPIRSTHEISDVKSLNIRHPRQ